MKTILKEWKSFVNEAIDYTKTPLEARIEKKWAEMDLKYNEDLANAKAAAHAVEFMSGGEKSNQQAYLEREDFGKQISKESLIFTRMPVCFQKTLMFILLKNLRMIQGLEMLKK